MICEKCGTRLTDDSKFCTYCGTKLELQAQDRRKLLTGAEIKKSLKGQKHSLGEYVGQLLLIALSLLIMHLGAPAGVIFIVFIAIRILVMIFQDLRRVSPEFYVLERECLEKKQVEHDEDPDAWQLWFSNADGEWNVAKTVEKDFYDATTVGEPFYVVFMGADKCPSLLYRKSEWMLDMQEFSPRKPPQA